MSNKLLGRCPVCQEEMLITSLACPTCSTEISGTFKPCAYCRLDPDQEKLVTVFLTTRGNIREVERELGISYPTVRARLDEVLKVLGVSPSKKSTRLIRAAEGGKETAEVRAEAGEERKPE